jgi:hypothetical protein
VQIGGILSSPPRLEPFAGGPRLSSNANKEQEKEMAMIRKFFIVAGLVTFAVISSAPIASANMSGLPTGNNGSTIPKVDAKPGPINKDLGLRIHCTRVPHYDKLGVLIVRRDCTLQ